MFANLTAPKDYVSLSFVRNFGICRGCNKEFKEGWIDNFGNEICNPCKEIEENIDIEIVSEYPVRIVGPDLGVCQGCGRYGPLGGMCIRINPDGEREECGEFV